MWHTTSQIREVRDAQIWVMNPNVEYIDDIKPLRDTDVYRVRGVEGVAWAVKYFKGGTRARLPDGQYQAVVLNGVDDATLVGGPREMLLGSVEDLRKPDAVIIEDVGYRLIWPEGPFELGKVFEMNDRRAVIVGVCRVAKTFQSYPIIYTRYSEAISFAPVERKVLSFVLAQPQPGQDAAAVCRRIEKQTGLRAHTREEFCWRTMYTYFTKTAIPIKFGITMLLGLIVGAAITAQTFYMFTLENLRQFGTLKALGTRNASIVRMVVFQALLVGVLGYALGIGLSAVFGEVARSTARLAFLMPWPVFAGTGAAVLFIITLSSVLSIRRVLRLDPAAVFQGF
jgi:putative ABC transport system permease protein